MNYSELFKELLKNNYTKYGEDVDVTIFKTSNAWTSIINFLESLRQNYLETKDKRYWKELIRLLPESWLQKRTTTMNYENLLNMCSKGQRRFHKLTEWSIDFMEWTKSLPYAKELLLGE